MKYVDFSRLLGKTLVSIERVTPDKDQDELIFTTNEGEIYKLFHNQDCCESVAIEDIEGDLNDLIGSPILQAEEIISGDLNGLTYTPDSFAWTFYKLATIKGYVTIRWLGESNGCYSENVDFVKLN